MNAPKSEAKLATDSPTKPEKKEVMQSNLPLLFANGSPISLESMNLVSEYVCVIFIDFYLCLRMYFSKKAKILVSNIQAKKNFPFKARKTAHKLLL